MTKPKEKAIEELTAEIAANERKIQQYHVLPPKPKALCFAIIFLKICSTATETTVIGKTNTKTENMQNRFQSKAYYLF